MGNVLVKEETLTQIADAIREKAGTEGVYKPGEMPEAILEISTYSEKVQIQISQCVSMIRMENWFIAIH